jgi:hypothetical protein
MVAGVVFNAMAQRERQEGGQRQLWWTLAIGGDATPPLFEGR